MSTIIYPHSRGSTCILQACVPWVFLLNIFPEGLVTFSTEFAEDVCITNTTFVMYFRLPVSIFIWPFQKIFDFFFKNRILTFKGSYVWARYLSNPLVCVVLFSATPWNLPYKMHLLTHWTNYFFPFQMCSTLVLSCKMGVKRDKLLLVLSTQALDQFAATP